MFDTSSRCMRCHVSFVVTGIWLTQCFRARSTMSRCHMGSMHIQSQQHSILFAWPYNIVNIFKTSSESFKLYPSWWVTYEDGTIRITDSQFRFYNLWKYKSRGYKATSSTHTRDNSHIFSLSSDDKAAIYFVLLFSTWRNWQLLYFLKYIEDSLWWKKLSVNIRL
jgi:hypothetical protein